MLPNCFEFTLAGVSTVSLIFWPVRWLSMRPVGTAVTCPKQTEASVTHTSSTIGRRRETESFATPRDAKEYIVTMVTPVGNGHKALVWETAVIKPKERGGTGAQAPLYKSSRGY